MTAAADKLRAIIDEYNPHTGTAILVVRETLKVAVSLFDDYLTPMEVRDAILVLAEELK